PVPSARPRSGVTPPAGAQPLKALPVNSLTALSTLAAALVCARSQIGEPFRPELHSRRGVGDGIERHVPAEPSVADAGERQSAQPLEVGAATGLVEHHLESPLFDPVPDGV